ncbi:MAG: phosphoribosylanthranilate isomerase [Planctomycetes bacterium]|nr:phosphoribosylanthranilate isomerase [Planctomycetota bacterium]
MTRVKICGITSLEDAQVAIDAGAHALGFVLADSPRRVTPDLAGRIVRALPPMVTTVGVFVDAPIEWVEETLEATGLHTVQLHGREEPQYCASVSRPVIKRIRMDDHSTPETLQAQLDRYDVSGFLLDPGAGDGRRFDWRRFAGIGLSGPSARGSSARRLMVAGGLDSDNVGEAIKLLRPYAVDVCTGVESAPGRKDAIKILAFLRAVEQADAVNAA